MLELRGRSTGRELTWMNMLVSGAALVLACGVPQGGIAYDQMSFRESILRKVSIQA